MQGDIGDGEKGGDDGSGEEVTIEAGAAGTSGIEEKEFSAGVSNAEDEKGQKLIFFFRNSSLLLAFLLWVEGLDLFFTRLEFTSLFLVSREKEKVEFIVREKLKSLPWLIQYLTEGQALRCQGGVHPNQQIGIHFHFIF